MAWKCKGCGETIEETFETCWNCGTDQDGVPPPETESAIPPANSRPGKATPRPEPEDRGATGASITVVSGPLKVPNLPGERLLLDLHDGAFLLTTHRLRHRNEGVGAASLVSIMLEEVASCSLTRRTKPWLLAFAFATLALGVLAAEKKGGFWSAVVVAAIFVVGYMATRRTVLAVASAGEQILLDVGSTPIDTLTRVINQVEAAKNERRSSFRGAPA